MSAKQQKARHLDGLDMGMAQYLSFFEDILRIKLENIAMNLLQPGLQAVTWMALYCK